MTLDPVLVSNLILLRRRPGSRFLSRSLAQPDFLDVS